MKGSISGHAAARCGATARVGGLACALVFGAIGALLMAPAAAALPARPIAPNPINVTLSAALVRLDNGNETLADAAQAKPGDIIEYRALYSNLAPQTLHGVEATLPIPPNTQYIPGSAQPPSVQIRSDGSDAYATPPLMRASRGADGMARDEPVPISSYRSLRWRFGELAAGAQRAVSMRVVVPGPGLAMPPAVQRLPPAD